MITTTRVLALLTALALSGGVAAQPRVFPEKSKVGWLEVVVFPQARMDGNPVNFTAGARIFNQNNSIVMPASVQGAVAVRYELEQGGQVKRAWILTPAEIEAARR